MNTIHLKNGGHPDLRVSTDKKNHVTHKTPHSIEEQNHASSLAASWSRGYV